MKTFVLIGCVLVSLTGYAQQFANTISLDLPDSAATANVEWVDLDNDGVLDVFAFATLSSGKHFFITYKIDTVLGIVDSTAQLTGFSSAVYRLADFDHDNDMDIIVSGMFLNAERTSFFENQSDFNFSEHSSIPVAGSLIHFADLNANGSSELIVSGNTNAAPFLKIYQFGTNWKLVHDSLKIEASSIEIFDFDGDSKNDIFISGMENNLVVTKVLRNQGGFYFKVSTPSKIGRGKTAVGDLNHDGRLDIFLTGANVAGQNVSIQYLNLGDHFIAKDTLAPLTNSSVFLADFNSDGKCDVQFLGKNIMGDTVNTIVFRDSTEAFLNKTKLHDQTFGDYDRDGDLDLLQLIAGTNSLELQLLSNDFASKNKGPLRAGGAFGFTIFNKLFLYWRKAMDDHTPANSITYDVTMHTSNSELLIGEFDLLSNNRLSVSHGNSGTRNYFILKPQKVAPFNYSVQSIDNSYESFRNYLLPREAGVCTGTAVPCQSQEIVEVSACRNETLSFTAALGAQWFSLSKGFLAEGAIFKMKVVASDTIFSFTEEDGCPSLKIYLIKELKNFIKKTVETKFVCEGQSIQLSTESEWTNILWKSHLRGNLDTTRLITHTVSQNDTVTLHATNDFGCGIEQKNAMRISKPEITLEGEVYQILKGESVQLFASGGITYQWSPEESLSNNSIANPIATPLSSTNYVVTVSDSISCTSTANVQVIVEGNAFIPNLFTPNDDGKNDEVKVYGIPVVSNFSFVIHNREGNVLYETKDSGQVSASGWDGTSNGVKQPAGVYYWKVKGEHASGRKLLLNGKTTGSIVLIR